MTTRSAARDLTRSYVDEATSKRWTDAELNSHLQNAVQEIHNELVANGFGSLMQISLVSASAGTLNLTSLNHSRIVCISEVSGTNRLLCLPTRAVDAVTRPTSGGTFEVCYYENPVEMLTDGYSLAYGDDNYSNKTLDQYAAVLAARNALIKDNEIRPGLETIRQELKARIKTLPNGPGTAALIGTPYGSRRSSLTWFEAPYGTINLVSR